MPVGVQPGTSTRRCGADGSNRLGRRAGRRMSSCCWPRSPARSDSAGGRLVRRAWASARSSTASLARGLARARRACARPGRPGDADPRHARRWRRRARRRCVRRRGAMSVVAGRWSPASRSPWTRSTAGSPARTGTVSALGARFDMEVDALLILVLSCYVARLGRRRGCSPIGAARYVFVVGCGRSGRGCASRPRRATGARSSRRSRASCSRSRRPPFSRGRSSTGALLVARCRCWPSRSVVDVWWLSATPTSVPPMPPLPRRARPGPRSHQMTESSHHAGRRGVDVPAPPPASTRRRIRVALGRALSVLAFLIVWFALVFSEPSRPADPGAARPHPDRGPRRRRARAGRCRGGRAGSCAGGRRRAARRCWP